MAAILMAMEACCAIAQSHSAQENPIADFTSMSLEELSDIQIISASKRPELLSSAAASIYVITREEIRRSGAARMPEILRLAPNLQVAQLDASQYAISARGFNTATTNKLLVLIDGRSVYTPLFSGIFWDIQDVLPENIERIEVMSGAGGTLWGANAVNGVINIITRETENTQGTLASVGVGTDDADIALRHGGKLGENGAFRLTAMGTRRKNTVLATGMSADDSLRRKNMGLRLDWEDGADRLMMDSQVYDGTIDQPIGDDKVISGMHLLGRWNRRLEDDSSIQIQAYFDHTKRNYPGTFRETLDTVDMEMQHRFELGSRHQILWGGGYRFSRDDVNNTAVLAFLPPVRDLTLGNIFMQDEIALTEEMSLTLGAKLEHNNYTGLEFQPNVRFSWKLQDNARAWSAISRSVRTPSRIDRDLFAPGIPPFIIAGGPDFQSEKITTYEVGYRMQPVNRASFSTSVFYNRYDELRSVEPLPANPAQLVVSNTIEGDSYGIEMWGTYRLSERWHLSAGYNYLKQNLRLAAGSLNSVGTQTEGNDPRYQFSLRSRMNLSHNAEWDVALRKIGRLPNPDVPGYTSLDMRLGWFPVKGVEVSLSIFNLLDHSHPEFGPVLTRSEMGRSVYLKTIWNF